MEQCGNLATLLRDAAQTAPQQPAIVTATAAMGWQQLAHTVASMAAGLRAAGLHPGDRVAVYAGMSPIAVQILAAINWAGLVAVPLNHRLSAPELQAICDHAGVAALVHEGAPPPPGIAGSAVPRLAAARLTAPEALTEPQPGDADTLAALVFTGGTTGAPKGVMLTDGDLWRHGQTVRRWLGYGPGDRVLQSQPLFHVAGVNQLYAVAMAQATLLFADAPGVGGMITAIDALGANAIGLVPTTLSLLLDQLESGNGQLHRLRNIVYGAAPITPELMARARRLLPNVRFAQFYGQTETGPVTALLPADHDSNAPQRLRSCGRLRPDLEMRIVAPSGAACPAGTIGEIQFRGAGLTRGYWHDEAQTTALFSNGWLRSGDLGFVDAPGYLTIVDRMKDMIVSGGENIYSAEVEAVLATHKAVQEVAVLGLPDPIWGEAVHAVVVPAAGTAAPTLDELAAFCRGKLAGYKIPRHLHLHGGPLPQSAVGKILKTALRQEICDSAI